MGPCDATSAWEDLLLSTVQQQDVPTVRGWIRMNGLPVAIAKVYYKIWSVRFQNVVESALLDRCLKEAYFRERDLQHILRRPKKMSSEACPESAAGVKLLWTCLRVEKHFQDVASHRYWLMQTFRRLVSDAKIFGELDCKTVARLHVRCERHDLSKFRLEQAVGYTLRWVHGLHSDLWVRACNLHLLQEDHHPQYYFRRAHIDMQKGDAHTDDERMDELARYESILDMVACRWERRLGGDRGVATSQLVNASEEVSELGRYCPCDLKYVTDVYKIIESFVDEKN
ncbi:uncharacterized protein LOC134782762 [Penaeus indicus]|uniref:uncharacterized protein LOC134782762 n=1 Tax=Penaeus indicus TaxID=29960 RepID=UPI00300D1C57